MASACENNPLFAHLAEGDEAAFEQLFHYYTPRLHPFIFNVVKSREVTEEIVQEVFLKLWTHRRDVAAKDRPDSWLFTVAANTAYTYIKRKSYERAFIDHAKTLMAPSFSHNATEELVVDKEVERLLRQAVDSLPAQRRAVFQLARTEGLSRREIAHRLRISPNTVKNQLGSAIQSIREFMRKAGAFLCLLLLFLLSRL
ncbi:MAG TPA: RNA polymerase sigma-70 factor [Puia sp.]|nr:RNA polymerase sigma-70 factor [Puia sp.]